MSDPILNAYGESPADLARAAKAAPAFDRDALYEYHGGAAGAFFSCGTCILKARTSVINNPEKWAGTDLVPWHEWAKTEGDRDGCDDCGLSALPNPEGA